ANFLVQELLRCVPVFSVIVKLSTITISHSSLTSTFLFSQVVDFSFKFWLSKFMFICVVHRVAHNGWVFLLAGIMLTAFCKCKVRTISENLYDVNFNPANRNTIFTLHS